MTPNIFEDRPFRIWIQRACNYIIREIVTSKHNFHLPSVSTISTMCAIHFSGALVIEQFYLSRHIVQATTKIVYFDVNKDRLENQRKKQQLKLGQMSV